jgi:hypothetical protein
MRSTQHPRHVTQERAQRGDQVSLASPGYRVHAPDPRRVVTRVAGNPSAFAQLRGRSSVETEGDHAPFAWRSTRPSVLPYWNELVPSNNSVHGPLAWAMMRSQSALGSHFRMSGFFGGVGLALRETGQALDRLGCRLAGNYAFKESRASPNPNLLRAAGWLCNTWTLGHAHGCRTGANQPRPNPIHHSGADQPRCC